MLITDLWTCGLDVWTGPGRVDWTWTCGLDVWTGRVDWTCVVVVDSCFHRLIPSSRTCLERGHSLPSATVTHAGSSSADNDDG